MTDKGRQPRRLFQAVGGARPRAVLVAVERLPHAHEDDVGEGALPLAEVAARGQELVDDLGFAEVTVEAGPAGGAKAATDRAADLRADADRGAGARTRGGVVLHHHR